MRKMLVKPLIVFLVGILCFSGCSSWKAPKEGLWYCEELKISIDFFYIYENKDPNAAKLYEEDGSYTEILCHIDYGTGLQLSSRDQQTIYLIGEFSWEEDKLTVVSYDDNSVYTFTRIE